MISHYDIEFGEQGSPSQLTNTSDKQLLLTELNPSGVYVVRVRANNYAKLDRNDSDIISGPFSNIATIRLPDPLPGISICYNYKQMACGVSACRSFTIALILSFIVLMFT